MKRTKVLALILAVAVLATAVFALTACKDDKEQYDYGNSADIRNSRINRHIDIRYNVRYRGSEN